MSDNIDISFSININTKNKLELIASPRGLSKLLRQITDEWVDENYPDTSSIKKKLAYHQGEIDRITRYVINMNRGE